MTEPIRLRLFLVVTFPLAFLGALIMGQRRQMLQTYRELWSEADE